MKMAALAPILSGALLLAACGADELEAAKDPEPTEVVADDPDEPAEESDVSEEPEVDPAEESDVTEDAEPEPVEEPAAALDGQIVVGELIYQVETVRNCEPFESDFSEPVLELQARTPEGGLIDIYVDELFDDEISWSGDEGIFSSDDAGMDMPTAASITIDGERVSGSGVLLEALEFEDLLEVSFDLPITDLVVCR